MITVIMALRSSHNHDDQDAAAAHHDAPCRWDEYNIHEPLLQVRQDDTGELIDITMAHKWPVRKPRPVAEKLPGKQALIT